MILCANCGSEMEDDAIKCPECGTEVKDIESGNEEQTVAVEDGLEQDTLEEKEKDESEVLLESAEQETEVETPAEDESGEAPEESGEKAEEAEEQKALEDEAQADAHEEDEAGEEPEAEEVDLPEEEAPEEEAPEEEVPEDEAPEKEIPPVENGTDAEAEPEEQEETGGMVEEDKTENAIEEEEPEVAPLENEAEGEAEGEKAVETLEPSQDIAMKADITGPQETDKAMDAVEGHMKARVLGALICGVLGVALFWVPILGLALSIVAMFLGSKTRTKQSIWKRGLAITGFVLGVIGLVAGIGALIWWVVVLTSGAKVFWFLGALA